MATRLFDPVALMSQNVAANATRRDPLPIGETLAQILEITFADGVSNKAGKPPTPWTRLDAKLEITDPEYCAQVPGNPEKVVTSLGVMIDMDNGNIAVGPNKNIRLGRLREATGSNGKPLSSMVGQYIRIAIGHKPHYKDDGNPDGEFYGVVNDEIVSYTKPE